MAHQPPSHYSAVLFLTLAAAVFTSRAQTPPSPPPEIKRMEDLSIVQRTSGIADTVLAVRTSQQSYWYPSLGQWVNAYRWLHQPDNLGRMSYSEFDGWNGSSWTAQTGFRYTGNREYNAYGKIRREYVYANPNGPRELSDYFEYRYNSAGLLMEVVDRFVST